MKKLSQRNLDIYIYIKEYIQNNGYSPSYREILDNSNYKSTASLREVLEKLAELKLLKVSRDINGNIKTRSIRAIENDYTKQLIQELRDEINE